MDEGISLGRVMSGPKVIVGSEKRRAGKIFVDIRGEKFHINVVIASHKK